MNTVDKCPIKLKRMIVETYNNNRQMFNVNETCLLRKNCRHDYFCYKRSNHSWIYASLLKRSTVEILIDYKQIRLIFHQGTPCGPLACSINVAMLEFHGLKKSNRIFLDCEFFSPCKVS